MLVYTFLALNVSIEPDYLWYTAIFWFPSQDAATHFLGPSTNKYGDMSFCKAMLKGEYNHDYLIPFIYKYHTAATIGLKSSSVDRTNYNGIV